MKSHVATLIVASDELSRAGLLGMLARTRYKAVPAKSGWQAAIDSGKAVPGLAILILSAPTKEPATVASSIEAAAKRVKVVVLADQCEAKLVRNAICAGAVAYLPRSVSADALLHTLDLVVDGEVVFPASLAREVLMSNAAPETQQHRCVHVAEQLTPERMNHLSAREIEILRRLVHGDSNKQISRRVEISETTVKVHVKAILRKLGVRNRTQAAIWGIDRLSTLAGATGIAQSASSRNGATAPRIVGQDPSAAVSMP